MDGLRADRLGIVVAPVYLLLLPLIWLSAAAVGTLWGVRDLAQGRTNSAAVAR